LTVRGASRARAGEIARGLVDLSHGGGALAEGSELDFEARVAAGP
jgi:hypothetical protein